MTEAQNKLRDLHFMLKNALGKIPLRNRVGKEGLSEPIEKYSFIESDAEPLDMWTYPNYYLDMLPEYAELTGLVTNHPDYEKMQDILTWFADNEDSLRNTGFDNETLAKHPELKPNPTGIANPADYVGKLNIITASEPEDKDDWMNDFYDDDDDDDDDIIV